MEQRDFKKAQSYWTTLKNRLKKEGSEVVTECDKLKLQSADGKFYKADGANIFIKNYYIAIVFNNSFFLTRLQ